MCSCKRRGAHRGSITGALNTFTCTATLPGFKYLHLQEVTFGSLNMFSNAELNYNEEMTFYYIYIERRYKGNNKSTVKLTWGKLTYVSLRLILSCMVMGFRSHGSKKRKLACHDLHNSWHKSNQAVKWQNEWKKLLILRHVPQKKCSLWGQRPLAATWGMRVPLLLMCFQTVQSKSPDTCVWVEKSNKHGSR